MNDDIKQILRDLEFASGVFDYTITPNRCTFLKDYITNLQESEAYYYGQYKDYKSRIEKAVKYIKQNCITSDKWEELGFCNFIPIGKITYKQLNKSKIIGLLNILNGRSDE